MQITELMTKNPACATPDTPLQEVAKLMQDHDCGCIPIVADERSRKPVGVVTDRDITCRTVAQGRNPLEMTARDVMTQNPATISADASSDECFKLMEDRQIRRVVVVDDKGACCGIIAQADVATKAKNRDVAKVVEEISQPNDERSRARGA